MDNKGINEAAKNKKDEFYTSYGDIEKEMRYYLDFNPDVFRGKAILCPCDNPNESNFTKYFLDHFEEYGIKRLISTCWSGYSDGVGYGTGTSLLDLYNQSTLDKNAVKGLILDATEGSRAIHQLNSNGDFRSDEVTGLRDESDMIITNPPFSLFREFMDWIYMSKKQFSVLGNIGCATYNNVFPHIRNRSTQLGMSITSGDREFRVPDDYPLAAAGVRVDEDGTKYIRVKGVRWYTNIPFNNDRPMLKLMTMQENRERSKHEGIRRKGYFEYDNYDALEVPFTDAIPSDYKGLMGVPITFLDKWNPNQFNVVKSRNEVRGAEFFRDGSISMAGLYVGGKAVYDRVIIRSV
ncbi:MAG: adenine-specific methyltransferase EcoRI family protein [Clostridia bacterium]|nr:adenine-specific methyltransferase EcoRI family protein [Clostridia bacterium]